MANGIRISSREVYDKVLEISNDVTEMKDKLKFHTKMIYGLYCIFGSLGLFVVGFALDLLIKYIGGL